MPQNIAKIIKDQTDSILRRRQVAPGSSMTVQGGTTQPGTGPGTPPEIVDPNSGLAAHKASGDHDGRYARVFTDLDDVPAAYSGQAGKVPTVKVTEDGLEFADAPPAANGLPVGGTAGQVPAKIDGTDYNAAWVEVDAVKIKAKPVNIASFAGKNGYILAYNEILDEWYLKADEGGGGGESSFSFFARSDKAFLAWNEITISTISEPV